MVVPTPNQPNLDKTLNLLLVHVHHVISFECTQAPHKLWFKCYCVEYV